MFDGKKHRSLGVIFLVAGGFLCCGSSVHAGSFHPEWKESTTRYWIGPEFWADRLQDWRLRSGRIECLEGSQDFPMRTVHLITVEMKPGDGDFRLRVRTGNLKPRNPLSENAWSGFLIGCGHGELDYRQAALIHHFSGAGGGLIAVFDNTRTALFRSMEDEEADDTYPILVQGNKPEGKQRPRGSWEEIELTLEGAKQTQGYLLRLVAVDVLQDTTLSQAILENYPEESLRGGIALVSHSGKGGGNARFWFNDLDLSGEKIEQHPERAFGPILSVLYSVNRGTVKWTAQFPPLGFGDNREAELLLQDADGRWQPVRTSQIEYPGYVARFRLEDMDTSRDHPYRVRYRNLGREFSYDGVVRREPSDRDELVIAGFTGNQTMARSPDGSWGGSHPFGARYGRYEEKNFWFPHTRMISNIPKHKPDLLVFTGDQIYESGSPTRASQEGRNPEYDYLYKWYLWCWTYHSITRNTPSIVLIDDHDVWMGNIWGEGGKRNPTGNVNDGGYTQDPVFQRMVVRTQCSHDPDPYAPDSLEQGMSAYFNTFSYANVGFAVLEDRTFKSCPKNLLKKVEFYDGKILDPGFDIRKADVPEAVLLGPEQVEMLKKWVENPEGDRMKVVLTQTVFSCVQTDWDGKPIRDFDSNGWPQSRRNEILRILKKGKTFILGGDQHLACVVQFGIDRFRDGPFEFGVPPVANRYRRWWLPEKPGDNRREGDPPYTGDFLDGFLNKMTVYAVANSAVTPKEILQERRKQNPKINNQTYHLLADRDLNRDGYGIVVLNKREQTVRVECWPWNGDPSNPEDQFPGWPITIRVSPSFEVLNQEH